MQILFILLLGAIVVTTIIIIIIIIIVITFISAHVNLSFFRWKFNSNWIYDLSFEI